MKSLSSVAVVGASGYVGFELAKLLLKHPAVGELTFYARNGTDDGESRLSEIFPHLRGGRDAPCRGFDLQGVTSDGYGAVLLATPHELSLEIVPSLLAAGLRVIDLSGAFRFRSPQTFSQWYSLPPPENSTARRAVYGLPELYASSLPDADLVANPGCYATSVILGLRPLVESSWLATERGIVCDCKSGASGAGKQPRNDLHFVEVEGNFRAYNLFTHRHTPEVMEHLGVPPESLIFSTHLLPVARGILSTLYVWLNSKRNPDDIEALYRTFYAERPLVRIWPAGHLPELQHVVNTNFCDLGFALDSSGERLIVVACLDNLGKGAAGQAIQNLNLMLGYEEAAGLR